MTQQTALITHALIDEPKKWRENVAAGTITNGYYLVALDGSRYGMGASTYQTDGAEREVLIRALNIWKDETGWTPPPVAGVNQVEERAHAPRQSPDQYLRHEYEKFASTVRSAHKSWRVHDDARVFEAQIQNAITELDTAIRPVTRLERKDPN